MKQTRPNTSNITHKGDLLVDYLEQDEANLVTLKDTVDALKDTLTNVPTVAALRLTDPTINGQLANVQCHTIANYGGGTFRYIESAVGVDDNAYTIVTTNGKVWIRQATNSVVRVDDCGLIPGGSLDTPLQTAYNIAVQRNIAELELPPTDFYNPYILTGGLEFAIPMTGIVIRSMGTYSSAAISHTGVNNYGLTFRQGTAAAALFAHTGLENVRVAGNVANTLGFVRFSDTWSNYVKDFWVANYNIGTAITLENTYAWTENFRLSNVLSRGNKTLIKCLTIPTSGGTDSMYGLKLDNVYHQFGVGNSRLLEAGTGVDPVKVYGFEAEVGGWFEGGGGHVVFLANGASSIFGNIKIHLDGYGGLIDGSDMRVLRATSNLARIDVTMLCDNQQGFAIDLSSWNVLNKYAGVRHLLSSDTPDTVRDGRNIVRAKGASLLLKQTVSTDRVITISQLPSFSNWRVRLTVDGTSHQSSEEYIVSVGRTNFIPYVTSQAKADGSPASTGFCIRPFNNLAGGSFSAGDGNQFDWVLTPSTGTGAYTSTLELIML